jgi:hypothetical protein
MAFGGFSSRLSPPNEEREKNGGIPEFVVPVCGRKP